LYNSVHTLLIKTNTKLTVEQIKKIFDALFLVKTNKCPLRKLTAIKSRGIISLKSIGFTSKIRKRTLLIITRKLRKALVLILS